MRITFGRYRLLGITLVALAATLLSGCSQRWSLEVRSLYSKPVRIYCDYIDRVPRKNKLLGEVAPGSKVHFKYVLDDADPVWHLIVKDTHGTTLEDIRAGADAIRAEARRAHAGEHVWRLTVGPKPSAQSGKTARAPRPSQAQPTREVTVDGEYLKASAVAWKRYRVVPDLKPKERDLANYTAVFSRTPTAISVNFLYKGPTDKYGWTAGPSGVVTVRRNDFRATDIRMPM